MDNIKEITEVAGKTIASALFDANEFLFITFTDNTSLELISSKDIWAQTLVTL
jgi:hypothetical protein